MKHWASTLLLLAAIVLCGCGGGQRTSSSTQNPPPPPPQVPSIAGNWQFNTTPTVAGATAIAIAGGISQSSNSVSGVMHVDGSSCFDAMTTVAVTGTLTGSNISMTSAPVSEQVITLTGTFTDNYDFTGTYSIGGGCADGEQGNLTGSNVSIDTTGGISLSGAFTNSGGNTFNAAFKTAQNNGANSDGSFGVNGTVTFQTSCFTSGTITPGNLSSGSFILGTSVTLVIDTGNGTVTFLGTDNVNEGVATGTFTVAGGPREQSGPALVTFSNPWDY
jgi:hypothetical protein